jgi:hypothetical protein
MHNSDISNLMISKNIHLESIIEEDARPFLSAYEYFESELCNVDITVKYAKTGDDVLRSQYSKLFLLHKQSDRKYSILISNNADPKKTIFSDLDFEEKKGGFGHELNHTLQYSKKNNIELSGFSLAYTFNRFVFSHIPLIGKYAKKYIIEIERRTDEGTIRHGLGHELARWANYFVNKSSIENNNYSNKFLSPDVINKILNHGFGENKPY